MKILIIQLARLGDILQTIPAVNAIRRTYPESEIHLLTRSRFKAAAELAPNISKHWYLDSEEVFKPLMQSGNLRETQISIKSLVRDLNACQFAQILNFSFSPASSFLTWLLSGRGVEARGYTRHSDGFFNPNEDSSCYFYGQVGIGKNNRVHITDLMAQVAAVNLASGDWYTNYKPRKIESLPENYVAIHIGASQANKTYPAGQWAEVIKGIKRPVVLIGATGERKITEEILKMAGMSENIIDLVGRTTFTELIDIIAQSRVLIGADSAPMAIAPFTSTPCLNLSSATVNFWETGPRSRGSRVLFAEKIGDINPVDVIKETENIIDNQPSSSLNTANVAAGIESFVANFPLSDDFEWAFIKALYMGSELPLVEDYSTILAMTQLREVNQIIMEQTQNIIDKKDPSLPSSLIGQADELITGIKNFAPKIRPLVTWYEVERTRIPPGKLQNIAERTLKICKALEHVLSLYLGATRPHLRRSNENFALESLPDFE